ncbi:conjugal transfer protein TraX [Prevotella multiformis]|uniref:TraX family protein n=1 Tax=Prevotella multiformis TaxID=282402 RepID=UPI001BA47BD3|nr:TraX family protein [Prevotella multiformis]QUB71741.1 conjugal transfer protein TraX [Prevotella multiformis]
MILVQGKGLSGSALKVIALVSMTLDHIACYLMDNGLAYDAMRTIDRMAFPIFAFLLVEGYVHTRSVRKYAVNLFVFALVSDIPWWLLNHDNTHNVFFTLLLGLVVMEGMNKIDNKPLLLCVLMAAVCGMATWVHVDYEYSGILLICAFYIFRTNNVTKSLLATLFMYQYGVIGLWLGLAVILCYNGQRGFINGQYAKYLCYAYYPLHFFGILCIL